MTLPGLVSFGWLNARGPREPSTLRLRILPPGGHLGGCPWIVGLAKGSGPGGLTATQYSQSFRSHCLPPEPGMPVPPPSSSTLCQTAGRRTLKPWRCSSYRDQRLVQAVCVFAVVGGAVGDPHDQAAADPQRLAGDVHHERDPLIERVNRVDVA